MSTSLYWKPVIKKSYYLPLELKHVLQKRFGFVKVRMSTEDLVYLGALNDAGVKGASDLIKAITKYDQVDVFEE